MTIAFNSPVLLVKDFSAMKSFYTDTLDQKIKDDFGTCISFACGLSIWQLKPDYPISKRLGRCFSEGGNQNLELCFETDEFEASVERIKAAGVRPLHDVVEESWGQLTFRFFDPEGNLVELGESMPTFVKRLYNHGLSQEAIHSKTGIPKPQIHVYIGQA